MKSPLAKIQKMHKAIPTILEQFEFVYMRKFLIFQTLLNMWII